MTRIYSTEVGRRVALSGLLPETAGFLLNYLVARRGELIRLLPDNIGRDGDADGLNFCLMSAALMSPEFSGLTRTRFIHFGFESNVPNYFADRWSPLLAERPWQAFRSSVNAAALMMEWIAGAPFSRLEGQFQAVRAGTIEGLCREVAWCLSGLADIVAAATKLDGDAAERPICLRDAAKQTLHDIRRLIPLLRLLTWRLSTGLPETVLWLSEVRKETGLSLISRREALALDSKNLGTHAALRQRNNWVDVIAALQAAGVQNAQERAKLLQQLADDWHITLRKKAEVRQTRGVGPDNARLIESYYESRGTEFEEALECLLGFARIKFTRFDVSPRKGAFDYLLHIDGRSDFPLECKSRQGSALVSLNETTDVLRATELHGYTGVSCATLCQPALDPNVPMELRGCARLCVVEAHILAEVLVQIAFHLVSPQDLHDWLSQPGHATLETFLPKDQTD